MEKIVITVVLAVIQTILTGCSNQAGWRFEIGVAPVNGLANTATLGEGQAQAKSGSNRY